LLVRRRLLPVGLLIGSGAVRTDETAGW